MSSGPEHLLHTVWHHRLHRRNQDTSGDPTHPGTSTPCCPHCCKPSEAPWPHNIQTLVLKDWAMALSAILHLQWTPQDCCSAHPVENILCLTLRHPSSTPWNFPLPAMGLFHWHFWPCRVKPCQLMHFCFSVTNFTALSCTKLHLGWTFSAVRLSQSAASQWSLWVKKQNYAIKMFSLSLSLSLSLQGHAGFMCLTKPNQAKPSQHMYINKRHSLQPTGQKGHWGCCDMLLSLPPRTSRITQKT